MIRISPGLSSSDLLPGIEQLWRHSAEKLLSISGTFDFEHGSPVFTVEGRYQTRGWTEWTLGFHFGSAILQFDATGDEQFLEYGRNGTVTRMGPHVTHTGVHDHGFNNVSTYGALLRLSGEGRLSAGPWERRFYELALKCSAAVQASRWTPLPDGGFIHSFNGAHSLFVDTIRTLRVLAVGHRLGHWLAGEGDSRTSLLERLLDHARATARYSVYYGEGRDSFDVRGRVAHESLFNPGNGIYRCPNSQQGFSPFSTWTRGLAWAVCGFSELLEFLDTVPGEELESRGGREEIEAWMLKAAQATADYYIDSSPTNGVPYWDTAAPNLWRLGDVGERPAEPFNDWEPVDSSAAAIAAQGLLRLGHFLRSRGKTSEGQRYWQAGLTVAMALFDSPYLCTAPDHQGLILHSVYHRPNGWDFQPPGRSIPCGESSMWGDYHARELALYLQRDARGEAYLTFWTGGGTP